MSEFRRRLMLQSKNDLPKEFKKVSYVWRDCSAYSDYINTGVYVTPNIKLKCQTKLIYTEIVAIYQGMTTSTGVGYFVWGMFPKGVGIFAGFDANSKNETLATIPYDTEWHEFYISNNYQSVDNVISHNNNPFSNNKFPLYIFNVNMEWNSAPKQNGIIANKEIIIHDNDIKIRHYVPCIRKSDNKAGLYDIVNNTFSTCAGLTAVE